MLKHSKHKQPSKKPSDQQASGIVLISPAGLLWNKLQILKW